MPAPVSRSHPRFDELSRRKDVHEFIELVCAGRDFPPCVLDDELLEKIELYIMTYGVEEGAKAWKAQLDLSMKALLRAASRNVKKLAAQGVDLWAL